MRTLTLILCGVAMTAGCQRGWNVPADTLDPTPITTDSAMERRQWDQSKAVYARTGVQSWPTLETWAPAARRPSFTFGFGLAISHIDAQLLSSPLSRPSLGQTRLWPDPTWPPLWRSPRQVHEPAGADGARSRLPFPVPMRWRAAGAHQ